MKQIGLTLCFCYFIHSLLAVTYTFSGTANWDTPANWSPSYPGTSIVDGDEAIIAVGAICTITSGTTISIDGILNNLGELTINGSMFFFLGQLDNAGIITNAGSIDNFGAVINNNGTFNNTSSFTNVGFFYNNRLLNNSSTFSNEVLLENSATGEIINTGTLTNAENLNNNGGTVMNANTLENTATGRLAHNGGTFTNTADGTLTNNGTLYSSAIFINEGIINNNATYDMLTTSEHYGTGAVNNTFPQIGLLSPADDTSVGTYTINGNYSQNITAATTYRVNIQSNAGAGVGHDILNISGTATLTGAVEIYFDNTFVPCVGEEYTIMTYSSLIGMPTSVSLFNTSGVLGTHISLNVNPTNLTVSIDAGLPNSACADLTVLLQGVYNGVDMNNDLGMANLIPTQEPYTNLGYTVTANANITTTNSVVASATADPVIDWVLLELRSSAMPTTVTASSAALVLQSGKVVDINGTSPVSFGTVSSGMYHIAVRHRNHLGVMTNTAVVTVL